MKQSAARDATSEMSTDRLNTSYGLAGIPGVSGTGGLDKWGTANETDPPLTTTVSGLNAGAYDVYAVFLTNRTGSNNTRILAGISGNPLVEYDHENRTDGIDSPGDVNWALSIAHLGATPAGSTSFSVDISETTRSFYIGVGYTVPEPSTLALGLLPLGLVALRRRRT